MIERNTQSYAFLEGLRKNWFLILFVGGLIVGWSNIQARQEMAESDIQRLESEVADVITKTEVITNNIVEIKTSLLFIREKLE